jgi:hypothetical protein
MHLRVTGDRRAGLDRLRQMRFRLGHSELFAQRPQRCRVGARGVAYEDDGDGAFGRRLVQQRANRDQVRGRA